MKHILCVAILQCVFLSVSAQTILPPEGELSRTPLGFPYIRHTENEGERPQPGQVVVYHAQMRNGETVHVTSRQYENPPAIEIPTSRNADAWALPDVQVLLQMTEGDSATIFLRIDTVETKPRGFQNSDWIAYDIVCLDIVDKTEWEQQQAAKHLDFSEVNHLMDSLITAYKKRRTREKMPLLTTDSGLQYMILKDGSGNFPMPGQQVAVHYAAYLRFGRLVDNSIERSESFRFTLGKGQVIEGWDEGVALLREGSEAVFFIPSRLAYGEEGALPAVPPHSMMVYFIKLLAIE